MARRTTRSEKLDLRLTKNAKRALQAAAAASHRSVSEFVLESALARVPMRRWRTGGPSVSTPRSGKLSRKRSTPLPVRFPAWSAF